MSDTTATSAPKALTNDYRVIRRVTVIGAVVDLVLAVAKLIGGFLTHSQALIADGIHSLSDLVTDALVIVAARHSSYEADREHPYGHGRIQAIAAAVLAASLVLVAAGIVWDALKGILGGTPLASPGWPAISIAAASVVGKEVVYHYTMRIARLYRSNLLKANAWHSRSDALSSLVVIAGVGGVMIGFPWADAAGAIGVAVIIFYVAYQIGRDAVEELIDTAVDAERQASFREAIRNVPGVVGVHELRTRRMGTEILADMHVRVSPSISVSEGHRIADEVMDRLKGKFDDLSDIIVHIDPEDDLDTAPAARLHDRKELEPLIRQILKTHQFPPGIDWERQPSRLILHYLGGRTQGQLILPLPHQGFDDALRQTREVVVAQLLEHTPLDEIEILFV